MGIPTVMMKTIMKPAFLMEEIVVDLMSLQTIAQYVNVLKNEELELQHLSELRHLPELVLV